MNRNKSGIARRDFLRAIGLAGLGLCNLPHGFAKSGTLDPATSEATTPTVPGRDYILVGLEIGTSKVCAVVGETRRDGTIRILGVGEAAARGVRKGEIVCCEAASKCIREALVDAEEKSDVMIGSVYLGLTGAHILAFNNRGAVSIPEERDKICEKDFEDVQASAREVSIPAPNMVVHSILQHYYVDGQDGVLKASGMFGRKLEADFHIIHGVATRIKNSVRCVKEVGPEVLDVVFNPLATAEVLLDQNQKGLGALVVDFGGGTIDYLIYIDGAVKQSGSLAIGGDHITQDISFGLRIPMAKAERLKIEEGCVILGNAHPGKSIVLKDETGFASKKIEREMLNTIIHCRVREAFELVKARLETSGARLDQLRAGMHLTGGGSLLRGVDSLAQNVFGLPAHLARVEGNVIGPASIIGNPQYSCAIGLVRFGASQG